MSELFNRGVRKRPVDHGLQDGCKQRGKDRDSDINPQWCPAQSEPRPDRGDQTEELQVHQGRFLTNIGVMARSLLTKGGRQLARSVTWSTSGSGSLPAC
jgi:hypothetical protein